MLDKLKNELNQLENDKQVKNKILDTYLEDLTNLFFFNNTNFKYDYKSGQELVLISYPLRYGDLNYKITYAANELRISFDSNCSVKSLNIEENDININDYYEFITKLNKFIFNIDRNLIIKYMINIKSNQKSINKINQKIKKLKEEITLVEKNKEFNTIEKVLPNFENFCIDSFLCDHYNVNYVDKPTRENLLDLKKQIIKFNQEKVFSFLVKKIEQDNITFQEEYLIVKENGVFYLRGTKRNKKSINEALSKQFYVNGKIATKDNFDKSEMFYTLFPKALLNKNNKFYYNYQGWGLKLNIELMKERLSKLALQKDLITF